MAMPVIKPSTQPTTPVNLEPIVGRLEREDRRSKIPVSVVPSAQEPRTELEGKRKSANVAFSSPTSSSQKQRSHEGGSASWGRSTLEIEAPPRWTFQLPAPYVGRGKERADKRSSDDRWKRPGLTVETFVPLVKAATATKQAQDQTGLPRVALKGRQSGCPGLTYGANMFAENITASSTRSGPQSPPFVEPQSPSPLLTSSPIPSGALTPTPPPTSPQLTSSPNPPSPVSTPRAVAFYTVPPRHTPRPPAASDQVRKYPTPEHEHSNRASPQGFDLRYHPQLSISEAGSDPDSYMSDLYDSPVRTVESTGHETGIFTANRHECTLRRKCGHVIWFSEDAEHRGYGEGHIKDRVGPEYAGAKARSPSGWEQLPQWPIPQAGEPQGQYNDAIYRASQPLQHPDQHLQQHVTPEQYLDDQRYELSSRLGHDTFPRAGGRPPTPYPKLCRSNTAPGRVPAATIESRDGIANGNVPQADERDAVVAQWIAQSRALAKERIGSAQLARSNAVKGRGTNSAAKEDEPEELRPQDTSTTKTVQSVTNFTDHHQHDDSHRSGHKPQIPHENVPQRTETMSPCGTFYTAASILEPTLLDSAAKPQIVVEQRISFEEEREDHAHFHTTYEEPPTPRPSSNDSRGSRFRKLIDTNGPTLYAAHTQTETQIFPLLLAPLPQSNDEGANTAQVTVTEIPSPTTTPTDPEQYLAQPTSTPVQINAASQPYSFSLRQRFQACKQSFQTWKHERKASGKSYKNFPNRRTAWVKMKEKLGLKRKPNRLFYSPLFEF
jgi:hypothetical protein